MNYPSDVLFDIETLINVAQPSRILLLGDQQADFLAEYTSQKTLLNQACDITHIPTKDIQALTKLQESFDVAIAINLFEHLDKKTGTQILSRLRDVLSPQYCICLPINENNPADSPTQETWQLTDLFAFALERVATYQSNNTHFGLFKYNINDYKKTPDWLNADNWANPKMWGKYWW